MSTERARLELAEPVAVLGVGVEGRATIDYLRSQGVERIAALDANPIEGLPDGVETAFGAGYLRAVERFATVFRSPGIRPDQPELEAVRAAGGRVTSAVDFFLARCTCEVIGVTGTVGKGTCASLATAVLEGGGRKVHLGGNIGVNPLTFLESVRAGDVVVLEISSFQAMDLTISPAVGVILKTTSEHLDWHRDTEEYRRAKAQLLAHQRPSDTVIFHADSAGAREIGAVSAGRRLACSLAGEVERGLFLADDELWLRLDDEEQRLPLDISRVRLPGRFNLENIAAALLAAIVVGVDRERGCAAAERFDGLPHRIEHVAEAGGIAFYNDSYATRPDATIAALSAFEGPLALILGGSEKHADFAPLIAALRAHPGLRHVSLIGATADRLAQALDDCGELGFSVSRQPDLEPAVDAAVAALESTGVVLLSPACASFGLFPNYKVRGERFREKVRQLARC
jgi:UDP-N-acetylmuramoylalanine--D-glutamate ligase